MSKLVEVREKFGAAVTKLEDLRVIESRTADQEAEIDRLLAEVNDLGPKLIREQQIEDAGKRASEFAAPAGRPSQRSAAAPLEERNGPIIDRRSLGQRFVETEDIKKYKGERGSHASFDAGSFYHGPKIEHNSATSPEEIRTLIYSGALAADMVRPQLVNGFFRGDDLQATVRDVLINGQTTSDAITFFRELAFTNNAAAVAESTTTAEGGGDGEKPESALTFQQATAPVVTIAHWIPITRQALDDTAQLQTYVDQRLLDGLKMAESDSILNGTGTPDLTGILQTGSVQALNAAYFGGAPVLDAGGLNENFNRILRAKTLIRTVGRARASFAVINPADNEVFLSATNTQGNYYGAGPFSAGGPTMSMWGLRVVEDENITAGTALVGDGRMAAVWDRMQAQIFIGWIDKQFIRNMLTILAEERIALTVFRPQAFAIVELAV